MAYYNNLTVAGTAVAVVDGTNITAAKVMEFGERARAHVKIETAPVRARADGTSPTSTVGTLFEAGQEFTLYGPDEIFKTKLIRTGASATAHITIYRE